MTKRVKKYCERCHEPTANVMGGNRVWCSRCERRMKKTLSR